MRCAPGGGHQGVKLLPGCSSQFTVLLTGSPLLGTGVIRNDKHAVEIRFTTMLGNRGSRSHSSSLVSVADHSN